MWSLMFFDQDWNIQKWKGFSKKGRYCMRLIIVWIVLKNFFKGYFKVLSCRQSWPYWTLEWIYKVKIWKKNPHILIFDIFSTFRYSHPTVTSGARPEYISLAQQQQSIMSRPYDHDMSKSYSPGTLYGQATSPGRRYII